MKLRRDAIVNAVSAFLQRRRRSVNAVVVPQPPDSPHVSSLSSLPSLRKLDSLSLSREPPKPAGQPNASPYDHVVARVERRTRKLGKDEANYLRTRKAVTAEHLKRFVSQPPQPSSSPAASAASFSSSTVPVSSLSAASAPSVAICLSGGGCRAMLGSMSALSTLNDMALLSSASYIAGLSGSTWAMAQIYSRPWPPPSPASPTPSLDLGAALEAVRRQVALPLLSPSSASLDALLPIIRRTFADKQQHSQQSLTLTDMLAWFIARRILSVLTPPASQADSSSFLSSLTLSSQRGALSSHSLPFPLYTAITSGQSIQFEFSPYEVGSWELAAFIPSWAFNRPFSSGASASPLPPEPHLSTLLSAFSSAHCSDLAQQLSELAYQLGAHPWLKERVTELLERATRDLKLSQVRPFDAIQFNSFLHGLSSNPPLSSAITQRSHLSLMDAGLAFNFPLVPLLQPCREVDVIVLVDFTSPPEAMNGQYLYTVKRYCDAHSLPLPRWQDGVQPLGVMEVKQEESAARKDIREGEGINTAAGAAEDSAEVTALHRACHSRVTVFPGRPGVAPSIVYIPLLSNAAFDANFCPRKTFELGGFTSTLNFVYSMQQSALLCGLVEANINECDHVIRDVVRGRWQQKQASMPLTAAADGAI